MKKVSWSKLFNDVYHGKRLIEFVALCMEPKSGFIRYHDIAEALNVDEETVKRYRRQLNCIGITIHSYKKTGISINRDSLSDNTINKFVRLYQAYLSIVSTVLNNENSQIINRMSASNQVKVFSEERELINLVLIQSAIERKKELQMEYEVDGERELHCILPLQFDLDDLRWCLVAREKCRTKRFHGASIRKVKLVSITSC